MEDNDGSRTYRCSGRNAIWNVSPLDLLIYAERVDGSDPCDLNLDLFCVELRCECEAIIERLPEGDEDDLEDSLKSEGQRILDDLGADDGGDGGDDY